MVAATTHHMGVATVAYARIHTPVRHPHVAPAASAKRSSPIALAGPRLGRAATRRSRKGLTVRAFKEWPQGSVSRSGGEQQQLRVGPSNKVMLAVDDRQEAVEAVAWALHNIVRKGDDVCLVHVVPDPRSAKSDAVANSPTGRPAYSSMDWGDLEVFHQEHRLRVLEAAEQRLRKRFAGCLKYIRDQEALAGRIHLPTVQGPSAAVSIGEALVQEAHAVGGRLLVLASHGTGLMAECGSVARHCCQYADLPLVLVPARMADIFPTAQRTLFLVASSPEELEQVVRWTSVNMARPGDVIHICDLGSAGALPPGVEEALYNHGASSVHTFHYSDQALKEVAREWGDTHMWDADEAAFTTGRMVCGQARRLGAAAVVLLNYARLGVVPEMLHGAVTRYVTHHSTRPVVLLPAEPRNV